MKMKIKIKTVLAGAYPPPARTAFRGGRGEGAPQLMVDKKNYNNLY
jgi:hypothetical protein